MQRATRGKALSFHFGASIHRVVGLDMADDVFEPGTIEMRPQWKPRIAMLVEELRKAPVDRCACRTSPTSRTRRSSTSASRR